MADVLCSVCKKKLGFFGKLKIKDGFICGDCYKKSMLTDNLDFYSSLDFEKRFLYLEQNKELTTIFSPTIKIENYLQIDENNKLFKVGKSFEVFPFSELIDFELNEDGETIVKGSGLGRALVGGVLLGGVGAIVGGVTGKNKTKDILKNLYILTTLNNRWTKTLKISIVENTDVKIDGLLYTSFKSSAERVLLALKIITDINDSLNQNSTATPTNTTDEIIKYKQLFDTGVITEDEFNQKKKQLLNI